MRYSMRLDTWWRPLLLVMGVTPERAYVEVDDAHVTVRFGRFHYSVPRAEIVEARRVRGHWLYGIGVHTNFVSELIVNGSLAGLVMLQAREPQRAAVLGMPIRYNRLYLSLEDPSGFLGALAPPRVSTVA
jgi:hypothetical protein